MRKKHAGPRDQRGHLLRLRADSAYHCARCCRARPSAVIVPIAEDLIADLRATPGVRFLDGPGSSPPYVVLDDPRVVAP